MGAPSKKIVLERIRKKLTKQIRAANKTVEQAREVFQVGNDRAENRGERGAIQEKSWLLSAQAGRLDELRRQLYAIQQTEVKMQRTVAPGALVYLRDSSTGEEEIYLLHPDLGGMQIELEGMTVFSVSPAAPLGAAMVGKKAGDTIELDLPMGTRRLKVMRVT
ncbi:MAG: GreA/GreB family elongation factor [Candidatus Eisenbacteria sp.]|nr:GreA/GreB family elongation factor [Candidatus Eisenbacteria bacterium]